MDWVLALYVRADARARERLDGQGMVEYGLIIAAVAIAVIIAIFALGPKIASMFSRAGASLSCDRNKKARFQPVAPRRILAGVDRLALSPGGARPGAQDASAGWLDAAAFYREFGVGTGSRVAPVDGYGVTLAAIQGVHSHLVEHRQQQHALAARVAALEARSVEAAASRRPVLAP